MQARKVHLSGVNTFKLAALSPEEMKRLFIKLKQGERPDFYS